MVDFLPDRRRRSVGAAQSDFLPLQARLRAFAQLQQDQTDGTVRAVAHQPQPHFESLDCPPSFLHTLTAVWATSHPLSEMPLTVDSVSLSRSIVNYDDIENIRIYLRTTSGR